MKDRQSRNRNIFKALTSRAVSRNKDFARFSDTWVRTVHRRFQVVSSLVRDAGRLGGIPETRCWIFRQDEAVQFHLTCPRLLYSRIVTLQSHEWEWLIQQQEIQALIQSEPHQALCEG